MKKHKICIVGGGLTGLISALVLSEKGLDIDLIVENTSPKIKDLRVTAISDKNIEFLDSLGRAKAVITSYDATPFLQSLNFNTPTIGYWESKYGMINPRMLNYFNDLKKNDILVSNENKINDILIKNFDTIENWWEKSNRLKVINKFRNNFCKDGKFETVFKNDFLKR